MVSVIGCLPEERRGELTAGRAWIERRTLLAPVPADGTVDFQCCHHAGEESLSEGDEALGVRGVAVLGEADLGSGLSHPYGYRGSVSHAAHSSSHRHSSVPAARVPQRAHGGSARSSWATGLEPGCPDAGLSPPTRRLPAGAGPCRRDVN